MADAIRAAKRLVKAAIRPLTHPWATRRGIAAGLRDLGVRRGTTLMVHSSLSALGFVPGGPRTVIAALMDAIGPDGTLVMPAHSWTLPAHGVFEFDVRQTPSCVGAISDAFWRWLGVVRSIHPTHSVAALGPLAEEITQDHELAPTPCGPGTPYAKLIERNASILFLGADLGQNTCYHTLEAIAGVPYLLRQHAEEFTVTNNAGESYKKTFLRHQPGPPRSFEDTETLLDAAGLLLHGPIGASSAKLLPCQPMTDTIMAHLSRDATFLLAK